MNRIVVLVGAKGGVGATTVAVELAKAMRGSARTALVDADFSGRRCAAILCDAVRTLDASRVEGNLASATVLGDVPMLEFTASIDGAFTLKPERTTEAARELRAMAEVLVVDAPQPYAAAVRPFVVDAALIAVIVEPTVLGVTSARSVQTELAKFGIPPSRLAIILNHPGSRVEVRAEEIQRALGLPLLGVIPPLGDRRAQRAISELAATIFARPLPVEPEPLGPSTRVPLGDRRSGGRRPGGAETGPAPLALTPAAAPKVTPLVTPSIERELRDHIKGEIHERLSEQLDLVAASAVGDDVKRMAELRAQVERLVGALLAERLDLGSAEDVARLRQEIIDEALGYGPLEDLLREPDVTEIMVNGPSQIYIEKGGKLELTVKRFTDDRHLRLVIERMIAPIGRRIDESVPMVDARLADGSRVNAIISPLSLDGPTLTIRRFGLHRLTVDDLVQLGAVPPALVDFLRAAVEARLNVVISGGTGSGKTTFLNVLSAFIPESERIVTIEDAAELSLSQTHVVRLESRPANLQGSGEIRIRDLVRNALRMRPDRIVVGECRGGEALDMLQAMNTGHDGSLTTVHANSARDAMSRIETMVLMSGFDLPIRAIREQIAGAVDLVVQVARLRDGSRKLMSVHEVVGLEGDVVTMQEIASFRQRGLDLENRVQGEFVASGVQPESLRRFEEFGVSFDQRALLELGTVTAW